MNAAEFYLKKQKRLKLRLLFLDQVIQKLRNWRLAVGLSLVFIFFASSMTQWQLWNIIIFLIFLGIFFILVSKNKKVQSHISQLEQLKLFYNRTELRKNGTYKYAKSVVVEDTQKQTLAMDLHLVGEISLLGWLDETLTQMGRKKLLNRLIQPIIDKDNILKQQQTVKQLAKLWWTWLKLIVQSKTKVDSDLELIKKELHKPILGPNFKVFYTIHILSFILVWALVIWNYSSGSPLNPILFFTLYLLFSLATRNQVATTFQKAHDMAFQLVPLLPLIKTVEKYPDAEWSQKYLSQTLKLKLSKKLSQLSRLTSFLSVQAHPLLHLALNALTPWDYFFSHLIERWRQQVDSLLPSAIDEVSDLEVLMSQALFFHFHTQTLPTFNDLNVFEMTDITHPLIGTEKSVANSFTKGTDQALTIITGSNMSGKSTFLRTFGINHQLALMGGPVFAKAMNTGLVSIRTCLKVHDSLEQGLSTFYYEVRQVSSMLEAAKRGEKFVYLIDEIFRGTNNRERLIGSQAVISELLKCNISGFISTHDLELAQLAEQNPKIKNFHFKDDVSAKNELIFSYKIQPGPCPTTNALKIIRREGIPVPEIS